MQFEWRQEKHDVKHTPVSEWNQSSMNEPSKRWKRKKIILKKSKKESSENLSRLKKRSTFAFMNYCETDVADHF